MPVLTSALWYSKRDSWFWKCWIYRCHLRSLLRLRQRMLLSFVVCNMLSHKSMRMSFHMLCNDISFFFLGLFCRRNGEWYFLFLRVENRCTWNWNRWWFYISYMFVYTLSFKKQGCIGIIEDCFVSQQHLMEEAPHFCNIVRPAARLMFWWTFLIEEQIW